MIFDSHCHLLFYKKEAIKDIVEEAKRNGVGILNNIATKLSEVEDLLSLSEQFSNVYCSVGVHPNHVAQCESLKETLISLATHEKVISIGETGLDYHYEYTAKKAQQESFREHIRAALESNLPLVVHSRNAETDTARILETELSNSRTSVILHSFASSRELFEAAIRNSWYVSFSGIVTFKNATEVQKIAVEVPLDRMLIETDAPYLSPVPLRGKTNYPSHVVHVLKYISKLRRIESEELSTKLMENFLRAFPKVMRPT
ncbi:hydrolase, TatD family [Neorickettsia risticii str. Illinois]|uniref:Hydrolase, TatD family n=1 Tax=Neorickettsia risticii (strain Illinois) TaxID=434131 RepID=C6V4L5_NEORI|nr:TatD family hydrolase [Neorickettsia risticii]ACT69342.1 hydrolase, TatD family [Neorickettsia risticii str. Illinois]